MRLLRIAIFSFSACAAAASCGGTSLNLVADVDAGPTAVLDGAVLDSAALDATAARACIPGQSIACVGPGGCTSNQVCNATGMSYGACVCAAPSAAGDASAPVLCVPGQSIACAGPGGCISSQTCNSSGSAFGGCDCDGEGGALSCIPGQSIVCAGPYGCVSYQACNSDGASYGACDCDSDGGSSDASLADGYAPLPPPVSDLPYNAVWSSTNGFIYLPLFSAPQCDLDFPYGEYYAVSFAPKTAGPVGTFGACGQVKPGAPPPCYQPERWIGDPAGGSGYQDVPGGKYTLSAFNADGIATGQMNTNEGIVPLVVKSCD